MGIFSRNRGKGSNDSSDPKRADFSHITTIELAHGASAEYKNDSMVPSSGVITATHATTSGSFGPTIDIW